MENSFKKFEEDEKNTTANTTKIKTKQKNSVSDREILAIIKEEKKFPINFSKPIKLPLLIKYYNKFWNNDFTDESSEDEESSN
jgi:hypothetical protein